MSISLVKLPQVISLNVVEKKSVNFVQSTSNLHGIPVFRGTRFKKYCIE